MKKDMSLTVHMALVFAVGALIAGGLAWLEGLSSGWIGGVVIATPLAIAYLFQFTFFYEVMPHEKGRRFFGWLSLTVLALGLLFCTFATIDLVVGVVLGVILPPLLHTQLMGRSEP